MILYKVNVVLFLLVLWCVPWYIYNRFIRTKDFHPMGKQLMYTPKWLSCAIPYVSHNPKKNKCENVKIDGWSIGHVFIYITLGMVLPGYWLEILVLSILCEAFEYVAGWRARWLLDPLMNLLGYLIGHLFILNLRKWKWLSRSVSTFMLALSLTIILLLNRPSMMPHASEFY